MRTLDPIISASRRCPWCLWLSALGTPDVGFRNCYNTSLPFLWRARMCIAIFTLTTYISNVSDGSNYAQKVVSVLFILPKCFFCVHFTAPVLHYSLVIKHCMKKKQIALHSWSKIAHLVTERDWHSDCCRQTSVRPKWCPIIICSILELCHPVRRRPSVLATLSKKRWSEANCCHNSYQPFHHSSKRCETGVNSLCRIDHEDVSWQDSISGVTVWGCRH